jgi:sugar diacid utilization regulator
MDRARTTVSTPPLLPQVDAFSDAQLRHQLSSIQGLLVLSMLMSESGEEGGIIDLAVSSVPSLGDCRLVGVYLIEDGWRATTGPLDHAVIQADVEVQFAVLTSAGGPVAISRETWAWAFPLRSLEGHYGHLVVAADRPPSVGEQFLLRVLAQQAGIALANANLHRRQRESADELRRTNAALAETVSALSLSTAIHDRLTRVAVAGEGQDGVARALHELTGFPVAVEDRHGNLQAWAGADRPEPYPKQPHSERDEMLRRAEMAGQPIRVDGRMLMVASGALEVLGVIAVIDPDGAAGEQARIALEHGATVLTMELSRLRALVESEMRMGRALVDQILDGTEDEPTTIARGQVLGYDLERPHRVVVVEPRPLTFAGEAFFHAVRRTARDLDCGVLVAERRRKVVFLCDTEPDWRTFCEALSDTGEARSRVGIGGVAERPSGLPRSYREALMALRMQDANESGDQVTRYDDLGIFRMLAAVEPVDDVERYVEQWLGALLDYDERRGADLVGTLSAYLELGRSHEATAKALTVHRSTLKYRLQRIAEISGRDLADPDTAFNLQLAARAWHTLLAIRSGSS